MAVAASQVLGGAMKTSPLNEQIKRHFALVETIARRLKGRLPASVDQNDLVAAGLIGLLQALERYEGQDKEFPGYARFRIHGAMLDELRAEDWAPKGIRQKANRLNRLRARTGCDEKARVELGLSQTAFQELVRHTETLQQVGFATSHFTSSEETTNVNPLENIPDESGHDPYAEACRHNEHQNIECALRHIPDKEADIVRLYYLEEKSMKEIGEKLHISESRVCQLRDRALKHMKKFLAA